MIINCECGKKKFNIDSSLIPKEGRNVNAIYTDQRKIEFSPSLVQGGGAIAMKKALVLLEEYIQQHSLTAIPVANVHDEFQYQVKENQADSFGKLAVQSIVNAGDQLGLRCSLTGEYKIGNNWKETH